MPLTYRDRDLWVRNLFWQHPEELEQRRDHDDVFSELLDESVYDVCPLHHLDREICECEADLDKDWAGSGDGEEAEGGEEGRPERNERGRVEFGDVVRDLRGGEGG